MGEVEKGSKVPMWKRRLKSQIKGKMRDLSIVEVLVQGRLLKDYHKDELERKYKISENEYSVAIFVLFADRLSVTTDTPTMLSFINFPLLCRLSFCSS